MLCYKFVMDKYFAKIFSNVSSVAVSIVIAAVIVVTTPSAAAESLGYTFVSVDYSRFASDLEGYSDDLNGHAFAVDFSFAVRPSLAIVGGYSSGRSDVHPEGLNATADVRFTTLGIIAHLPASDKTDFILGVSFFNGEFDVDSALVESKDADGGTTIIGIRTMYRDDIELNGYVRRRSVEDDSYIGIKTGISYYTKESVSIDFDLSIDSNIQAYTIGLTKYF